ncbi:hypothetical protein WJX73_005542 [Symbiochloris irregularis]|uniref:50S ribosomal protein L13 n=1 Tax=Symbiochloris irregularis TaxID=706552 RepID=A0AAW1P0I3_9CHLO
MSRYPVPQLRSVDLSGLRFRFVDANEQVVGRLASQLARILQGKDKPIYSPEKDLGDVVVVVNGRNVQFTGKKWEQKLYRWHTGYVGGLKERQAKFQHTQEPESILWKAVNGMLPKNKLRQARMRKLCIYPDAEHPFDQDTLVPWTPPERRLRIKEAAFKVPEGFQPLNPAAYTRRFGHLLSNEALVKACTPAADSMLPRSASS